MTTPLKLTHEPDAGNGGDIIVHRHTHAAPPLLVSDATAEREGFRDARAWRKFARAARAAGYAVTELGSELAMLRRDVEKYIRASGTAPTAAPAGDADDVDAQIDRAVAAAGLRVVGGR